jgi:hypothetical protein
MTAPSGHAEIETNGPLIVMSEAAMPPGVVLTRLGAQNDRLKFEDFDSMLTGVRIDLPDDSGVTFEDSDELFRADIQQRASGMDQTVIERMVSSKVVPIRRPKTCPPLLV